MSRGALLFCAWLGLNLAAGWQGADAANGRRILSNVGVWTAFERRGWQSGYYGGELIQKFDQFDAVVGHTYKDETSLQLDALKAIGVNHITFELRTSDADTAPNCGPSEFPSCKVCYVLGLDWPKPPAQQLTNLKAFFDLVADKHMKVDLSLTIMHMDEPHRLSVQWLGSILDTVKDSPALGLVLLNGDARTLDLNGDGVKETCGVQAEPPLWLGPNAYAGKYLKWAIPFAISRGVSPRQVTAESIVGDFFVDSEPGGPSDHLWKPIRAMKAIFDAAKVPVANRSYAVSFYERRKCSTAQGLPCTHDLGPHVWAENRLKDALATIGATHKKQFIMTEGGTLDPTTWPAERAYESLGFLMNKYGTPGGDFWRWTVFDNSEEGDPNTAKPVKQRGVAYNFFPPKNEIVDLGGYHLTAIPNGSFEAGSMTPTSWKITGTGKGLRYHLAHEANQPQVPSRGEYSLRLRTGGNIQAVSQPIAVDPNRTYTTTGNLRFLWSGDPPPGGDPATRPQVFVTVTYYQANGQRSAVKASDTFRYFQEDGAADFRTFPIQYQTPADAAKVRLTIGVAANGLPSIITLDADNLR
jgi:hypothetical protein